jgi:hypothetical protein
VAGCLAMETLQDLSAATARNALTKSFSLLYYVENLRLREIT